MPEPAYETRPLREDERDWLSEVLLERRGRALIVGRGRFLQLSERSPPAPAAHRDGGMGAPFSRRAAAKVSMSSSMTFGRPP